MKICTDGPCENGGNCKNVSTGGVTCLCVLGYIGHFCERTYFVVAHTMISNRNECSSITSGCVCGY